jgi:hypothetical protein
MILATLCCAKHAGRTIAELTGGKKIQSAHLADALQYPPKLMLSWGGLRSHLDGAKG